MFSLVDPGGIDRDRGRRGGGWAPCVFMLFDPGGMGRDRGSSGLGMGGGEFGRVGEDDDEVGGGDEGRGERVWVGMERRGTGCWIEGR